MPSKIEQEHDWVGISHMFIWVFQFPPTKTGWSASMCVDGKINEGSLWGWEKRTGYCKISGRRGNELRQTQWVVWFPIWLWLFALHHFKNVKSFAPTTLSLLWMSNPFTPRFFIRNTSVCLPKTKTQPAPLNPGLYRKRLDRMGFFFFGA